jgi:prepilin-type N-terminal cleavage/methylation domain-containing protein
LIDRQISRSTAPTHRPSQGKHPGPPAGRFAGYTLIEMAIVIVALSILSVLSYVKLQPSLEHGKVNSAAAVMAADFQYAQLMAARQRKPVVIIIVPATRSYIIRDRTNATQVFRTRYMGANTDYSLDMMTGNPSTSIQVFATGITPVTTTFTLGLRGYLRLVKFTKAGQVRVLKA